MRILTVLAASALVLTASSAMGQDLTAKASALREKALSDPTGWNVIESLTTEVGARPVGSQAMERAKDWGVAKLKELGFTNVHVEPFTTAA